MKTLKTSTWRRFMMSVAMCLCLVLSPMACANGSATGTPTTGQGVYSKYHRYTYDIIGLFKTVISIVGYCESQSEFNRYVKMAESRFTELHEMYDIYKSYKGRNNLFTVNQEAGGAAVKVDREIIDLLEYCRDGSGIDKNRVDITLGAMLAIWSDFREAGRADPDKASIPDMASLQAAAKLSGMDALQILRDDSAVRIAMAGLQLDVGAVAKGYATEIVKNELAEAGWGSFLISNGASSIALHGRPFQDGKETWSIGMQNPSAILPEVGVSAGDNAGETPEFLAIAQLNDRSIGNSGDYQNFYKVDGISYNHLIDPDTLMPATAYRGVSVFADHCGLADLLSSTLFLLPYEEGRQLVESMDGVDAIWVFPGGRVETTPGISPALTERIYEP